MSDELAGLGDANLTATGDDDNTGKEFDYKAAYEKSQEELKATKDSNSNLGRKLKTFQEDSDERYEMLLDKVSSLESARSGTTEDVYDDDDLDGLSAKKIAQIAAEAAEKKVEDRDNKRLELQQKYMKDYDKTVMVMGEDVDPGIYEAVLHEMEGMPGKSTNGSADAEYNFHKAYISVLKNGNNPNTNTSFRQNDPRGTRVGGSSAGAEKDDTVASVNKAKQDPWVQGFLNYRSRKGKNDGDAFLKRAMENKPISRV
jgi:hypothetical protein